MFFGARYLESEILEWYRLSRVLYITTSDTSPIANTVICYQWKNTVIVIFAPMWGCASVRCHCPPVNLCPVSVIEMSTVQCIFWNDSESCEQPKDFCTINIKHWLENLLIHSSHLIVDCPTHYSTGLRLDFHLFLDLTKRTQQGNLLHLIHCSQVAKNLDWCSNVAMLSENLSLCRRKEMSRPVARNWWLPSNVSHSSISACLPLEFVQTNIYENKFHPYTATFSSAER